MARVVLACALKHHTRRSDRDPARWQHASQLVTHHLLQDAGFRLPPDAEAWGDVSVEQAYDRLPEPQQDDQSSPAPPSGPSPQTASPAGATAPESNDPKATEDDNDADQDNDDRPSKTEDRDRAGDPASSDPAGTGEIMDAAPDANASSSPETPDFTKEEQDWDEAMHQALNLAKAQGSAPGALANTVEAAHSSRLDWLTLLRRYMTDACNSDYSWAVPNRRFIDSGLYLPSIHSEGISSIAVFIDTSWSLTAATLSLFWTALLELASEIRPDTIHVLQIDTVVRDATEYDPAMLPREITLKGRGGTDFRPGFSWLEDHRIAPTVCVYLTDMLCDDYPATPPPFPVIWVNWGDPPDHWNREPWGERVDIPPP